MDLKYTEIAKDLNIIEDLFCETEEDKEKLLRYIGLTEEEFTAAKADRLELDKAQLEDVYNFAYNHNLYLNEISWLEVEDEFKSNNITIASHGAHTPIVGDINLKKAPGSSNDFADGFYVGEGIAQAGMWVANDLNSSLYIFTFDKSNLKEARFDINIDWMLAVAYFRNKLDDYVNTPKIQSIAKLVDECDYVYAPIADNNLFEVIDAFASGEITDLQCLYALSATHLGYQLVLKNERALNNLDLQKHLYFCAVEKSFYNKENDIESNTAMNKAIIAKKRYANVGKYIDELLSSTMNESFESSEQVKQSIENGMEVKEYKGLALLKWPNQRDVVVIDPITDEHCGIYKSQKEARDVIDGKLKHLGEILPPGQNGRVLEELKLKHDYEPEEYTGSYYIDSWWDKHTRSYVTQVKDEDGNEIDCQYSGNKQDRDFDIDYFKKEYNITESIKKKKKKEKVLPYVGINTIIPDAPGGIDNFNNNSLNSGEGAVGGSSGE